MKTTYSIHMPNSSKEWLLEIAEAYLDAYDAIPFGKFVGQKITEKELFHMTPHICLKFRGIKKSKKNVNKATDAMLASYVATEDQTEDIFRNPHLAFCFGYLACHFALGLLTENEVAGIMDYMELHQTELKAEIEDRIERKSG
jgi:hypothetical protein